MTAEAACSIIVPLFNKVELTAKCVQALREHTRRADYELILIDNGSTDATQKFCDGLDDDIIVIRNDINQGFAKACNQGAAAATGAELMFLNNDTEVHSGWLEPLLAQLTDEDVGAVGSKLLYPDGSIQHCGVIIVHEANTETAFTATHWLSGTPGDTAIANEARPFQIVTAACVLFRREAFEAAGGFDEGYWNGYEDIDLCLQLGVMGWKIMYEPASVVTHFESASGYERFRLVNQNVRRLMERWADRATIDVTISTEGEVSITPDGWLSDLELENNIYLDVGVLETTADAPPILGDREALIEKVESHRLSAELDVVRRGREVCWIEDSTTLTPLVTIRITATEQNPSALERTIRSATVQTHENLEILIIGGQCNANTISVVGSFADPRIRFVNLPTQTLSLADPDFQWLIDGAAAAAITTDLASGDWLAPCAEGDELARDHVEILLTEAKDRGLEMIWSRATKEDHSGAWTEIGHPRLRVGHVYEGSVLYSLGLRHIAPNQRSWRLGEPHEWNLWRRMHDADVRMGFVDHLTVAHPAMS